MSQATLDTPTTSSTSDRSTTSSGQTSAGQAPPPKASAPPSKAAGQSPPRAGSTGPINYASKRAVPQKKGVNFRLVLFIAVVGLPLVGISWLMVRGFLNNGISWHGDYAAVDLKALGNFPFSKDSGTRNDIPERWRNLDGKNVALEGFMFQPQSAESRGTEFQFVYNVNRCCFNGPPLVQERVYGHARTGDLPIYDVYTCVRVVGILHVRVVKDRDGIIHSVFDMDVKHVEPLEG